MPIEELTSIQIALKCGVSERTIQRWIKERRLAATRLAYNRYAVDTDDLQRMRLAEHINEETRVQALERQQKSLEDRIEQLEQQLKALQSRLDALLPLAKGKSTISSRQAHSAIHIKQKTPIGTGTAVNRIVVTSREEIPEDVIPLFQFAKEYHITNVRSLRDQVDNNDLPHYAYFNQLRNETERYVNQDQQQTILNWLKDHNKYPH